MMKSKGRRPTLTNQSWRQLRKQNEDLMDPTVDILILKMEVLILEFEHLETCKKAKKAFIEKKGAKFSISNRIKFRVER